MRKTYWGTAVLLAALFFSCNRRSGPAPQIPLQDGWKFKPTDNLEFARPDFDDRGWTNIGVDKTWNKQGFPKYEGFGWYRIKVIIPSSLKKKAYLQDSVIFHLGRIDDFDQVFLNGELIGENLKNMPPGSKPNDAYKNLKYSFWDVPRRYSLPADDPRIRWDRENVIAVRVFDWGVAGGIYSGDLRIAMPEEREYFSLRFDRHIFQEKNGQWQKTLKIKNKAEKYSIEGRIRILVKNNISGKAIYQGDESFQLQPGTAHSFRYSLPKQQQSASAQYTVLFENSGDTLTFTEGVPYILTPPEKERPQINGALVYGQRPGKPFLYRIAATGRRPMSFLAVNLPEGLMLDTETGIITGKVNKRGVYKIRLIAENELGKDEKTLTVKIGDTIALTPPMGWNSWNCWGLSVTQERVYAAAKSFVESGLADHGWTYINIDDGWEIYGKSQEAKRTPDGEIRTNEKFPEMKKLGKDIHALGLKFGIYSSPGPLTCGGYTASYGYEERDAHTFADWGIDYLKYDLCTYRDLMTDQNDPKELMPPYKKMQKALAKQNRDIVYSLCEYGNGKVWEWGAKVGGNLWRTTGDIWDDWDRMFFIGFNQEEAAPYAGPGHWNDPDMLIVGWVGWGEHLHPTNLTPDEQYTHVSLWALLAAPLLLGNDLTRLDDFTLNLLTNDEVLAVDQDPLGRQGIPVIKEKNIHVYKKELSDGSAAVGIFNTGRATQEYTLYPEKIGIRRGVKVRDLWRQKDLGRLDREFKTVIPPHGVTLIKVSE
ncbi:MAG TPA: alpha-galactosidase [Caldithrix abyssi]|uniref:Alpha-galactosidase n=1 Tax=Caldithrix abyssi TaxID=187145 RepID=A0A7V4WWA9_CALAY|nr:alpha-galactosidase [Caldithrix abyssi]